MALGFAMISTLQLSQEIVYTMYNFHSLGITSSKRKKEERRFVDLRIVLILHCSNEY